MELASRDTSDQARNSAAFKKAERERDGEKAMAEYLAEGRATQEKTARLRALRLARDAAAAAAPAKPTAPPVKKVTSPAKKPAATRKRAASAGN
jgi:hypothetical protein